MSDFFTPGQRRTLPPFGVDYRSYSLIPNTARNKRI